MDAKLSSKLVNPNNSKMVLLVLDGLGGLPKTADGKTELETAATPNLDTLAKEGICGLHNPIRTGITPGSGPAHLGLFGYDPIEHQVGRGVLAALGVNFDLQLGDVAARGNFCTVDADGFITDRRAGRIPTDKCQELCDLLSDIEVEGCKIFIQPVKDYRFLIVMRGEGLSGDINDTDPQEVGKKPLLPTTRNEKAEKTVVILKQWIEKASARLADLQPANMFTLRGFAEKPDWHTMQDAFGIKAGAIAAYPMYRGVAKLVGMDVLKTGSTFSDEFDTLEEQWDDYDFFFLHIKTTDSAGEDGDFDKKVSIIEEVDALIPRLLKLNPDVIAVTGDHSTPAVLKSHSWHPVPTLIWAKYCRPDLVHEFGERACMAGGLGANFPATDILPVMTANAQRFDKFGA
ncbi:MAG: 2,3-bisphosphoglycerate-independent phosphoglycerate mutase [Anaerolineaceae bacterium]|nr:2,3-bisphosphoglycerate-independent phosphoglycerate mutase [Anaerolineaceae bacterium]